MNLRERLEDGQPPFRVSELAALIGYSRGKIRAMLRGDQPEIASVRLSVKDIERRVPVTEVRRLLSLLGMSLPVRNAQFQTSNRLSRSVS